MCSKCLRLRAKGVRCSCQIAFAVERDDFARVVRSRASSMSPMSSIPYYSSLLCGDCFRWVVLSAAEVESVSGYLARGSPPNPL